MDDLFGNQSFHMIKKTKKLRKYHDYKLILGNPGRPYERIPPDQVRSPSNNERVGQHSRVYFHSGKLFDMTVEDRLLEEHEVSGKHEVRNHMKRMIIKAKKRGWKPQIHYYNFSSKALEMKDSEGQPYIGPGWC